MIDIKDRSNCCGCAACVQRCPKQCITMRADNEGFLYPRIDTQACIDCGLCEKVCPVINQSEERMPFSTFAAVNPNEQIRRESSSGGIFTMLAEKTIAKGGVVFGVKFNKDWMPEFGYAETMEDIAPFRGSKYVQAIVGNAYRKAEEFLKAGREVLFSGTSCQIAGLKKFLRKEYDNLLAVDVICHGAPSPKIWNMYLEETCSRLIKAKTGGNESCILTNNREYKSYIETISFRSKINGWAKYSFMLKLNFATGDGKSTDAFLVENVQKNIYLRAFLSDMILRPSCYSCPAKAGKSGSDLTLADYWGIYTLIPELDDDKGVSAITANTVRGEALLKELDTKLYQAPLQDLIHKNPSFVVSTKRPVNRDEFFKEDGKGVYEKTKILCRVPFKIKCKRIVKNIVFGIFGTKTLGNVKKAINKKL